MKTFSGYSKSLASDVSVLLAGGGTKELDKFAMSDHNHDDTYAAKSHNHDSSYAAKSHTHSYIESKDNYTFTSSTLPNSFDFGISAGFVNSNSGFGSYGTVLTVRTYTGGGGTLQLYAPYSDTYGGSHMKARFGNYDSSSGNSWTSLKTIAWTDDIPSSLPANGGNADTTDGLHVHSGRNNEANKIVRTQGNGYILCGYINSSNGDEANNSSPARVWGTNGSDSYMRTYLTSALSVNYATSAGSATTATNLVDGSSRMTSAYNKAGLDYSSYTWLAGWNGYELRAVAKTQFATSGHNHDSTYAKLAAHNNLTASGNEFTFASNAFSGDIWINYRTAGGTNGNITQYNFGNGKGGSLASITSGTFNGNCTGSAGSVAWGNVTGKPSSYDLTNLTVINDNSQTGYDALVYLRHYSTNDWTLKIDDGGKDYGLYVCNSGANAAKIEGTLTATTLKGNLHWDYLTNKPTLITADYTGHIVIRGRIFGYNYNNQGSNYPAFVWDKPGSNFTGMGPNGVADQIHFGPVDGNYNWVSGYNQKWDFLGNVYAANFYTTSDIRKKTNIINISDSIRQFNWKDSGDLSYGFIAQELDKTNPELVDKDGDHWTVNYNAAICLVIARLENRIKELEKQLGV